MFNLGIGYAAVVPERDPATDCGSGASSLHDRRSGQWGGDEPPGAPRRGSSGRRGGLEPGRRTRARAGRARRGAAAVFELDAYPGRVERDAAMADWLAGHERRARRLRRLHAPAAAELPRPLRGPHHQDALGTPAGLPGAHPIEDVLAAGVPETAATVHYVDEGIDTGAVIQAEAVPVRTAIRSSRCGSACRRSSTASSPPSSGS